MVWIALGAAALLGAAAVGPVMSDVEQPKYTVVQAAGEVEIREYAPMVVAEVETTGAREDAIRQGFKLLAGYIFGDNTTKTSVAMTAPMTQQANEKIAMTAPVTQQAVGSAWKVHFVMPAEYTLDTLPKPNNKAVKLRKIEAKRFATIQFSGMADAENMQEHEQQLTRFLQDQKLVAASKPAYAFFNPPWTLPFFRRNEIMIELKREHGVR